MGFGKSANPKGLNMNSFSGSGGKESLPKPIVQFQVFYFKRIENENVDVVSPSVKLGVCWHR